MSAIDFSSVVADAWRAYKPSRPAQSIVDISAQVSTNHVYKVQLNSRRFVVGKVSYFGRYEHFREDHTIINTLANSLPAPYTRVLARSLLKGGEVFTYRHEGDEMDVWVVFYNPVRIREKMPRRLDEADIVGFAREMARFHRACAAAVPALPHSSKTLRSDVQELQLQVTTEEGARAFGAHVGMIEAQCVRFIEQLDALGAESFLNMPVFVDWNIGNFSLDRQGRLFSRWDYDWFRMSSRMLDFYFFSRVVSDVGDRTLFHYLVDPLMEDRFVLFLRTYHACYPLTAPEVRFLKEAYRFFILNYVVKYGQHFFRASYANQLQNEAFPQYFPDLDARFDAEPLLAALALT